MTEKNGNRKVQVAPWVAIALSGLIGLGGITFAWASQANVREMDRIDGSLQSNRLEIKGLFEEVNEVKSGYSVIENELGHVKRALDSIGKDVKRILEER